MGAGPARQRREPRRRNPRRLGLFFEDFATHPPTYILDTAYSGIRGAKYYTIARYPALARVVYRDYEYVETVDGIGIYKRRPDAPSPLVRSENADKS